MYVRTMSSPPLRVFLTKEQDQQLVKLKRKQAVPQITLERAELLRLSSRGWKVEKLASYFNWTPARVRATIHRWQQEGLDGLWNRKRSGRKPKWKPQDIEFIETNLTKEARTYNSRQLCQKLAQTRNINLSTRQLRRILKKRGSFGNEHEHRTVKSKTLV